MKDIIKSFRNLNFFKKLLFSNMVILLIVFFIVGMMYTMMYRFIYKQTVSTALNDLKKASDIFDRTLQHYENKAEIILNDEDIRRLSEQTDMKNNDFYTMSKAIKKINTVFLGDEMSLSTLLWLSKSEMVKYGDTFYKDDDPRLYTIDGRSFADYYAEINSEFAHIPITAVKIGYTNVNSFCKAFKRVFGMTPTEYKKSALHQKKHENQ